MKEELILPFSKCKNPIGLTIKIFHLANEKKPDRFCNKVGIILSVDDYGQLHGNWGSIGIIPELDKFIVIDDENDIVYESQHLND